MLIHHGNMAADNRGDRLAAALEGHIITFAASTPVALAISPARM